MIARVLRLYPPPAKERPVEGLYLTQGLQQMGTPEHPFVYTSFIVSLDGRISQRGLESGQWRVPPAIANKHDRRLHMELAIQADVFLTTSRHLRAVASGRHSNLLALIEDEYSDLTKWREEKGLPRQPPYAAVSKSLGFPARTLLEVHSGPVMVLTSAAAPSKRVHELERAGIEVICVGSGSCLDGAALIRALAQRGYANIYSIAGPQVLHTLLDAGVVDRLYLTIAQVILGGERYDTLSRGAALNPPQDFELHELYLDRRMPEGAGQLIASFNHVPVSQ